MRTHLAALTLVVAGTLALGAAAPARIDPVEHFTAKAGVMTSGSRFTLRIVNIVISRWSTYDEHRALETTLLERGWVEFMDQLCNLAPAGTIGTIDGREIAIRYAWEAVERGGHRRVFLATDEPISFAGAAARRSALADPLTFVELRVDAKGEGEGKLSEAARLSVDQTRDIIELRDYADRPLHLIKLQNALRVAE
jgi:hypothetical protein